MKEDKRLNEVIRIQKRENNFVMLDKGFLENKNLSWKAKGILAYLLSKPDDWKVIVGNLVKQSTDGKTAVYSGLKELSEEGYYIKRPIRNDKGNRIVLWESIVFEIPENNQSLENTGVSLLPDFPKVENLDIENQFIENQERNNNYITKNYNTNNNNQSCLSVGTDGRDRTDKTHKAVKKAQEIENCIEQIKQSIDYESFEIARQSDIGLIDEFITIILDVLVSDTPYVVIDGGQKPRELVKRNFMQLQYKHIELVLNQFLSQKSRIKKKKQYVLSMMYNATLEVNSHYSNWVESDKWEEEENNV